MSSWPMNYAPNSPRSGPIPTTPISFPSVPMTAPCGTLPNVSSDHILPQAHYVILTTPGPDRMKTKLNCLPIISDPYFSPPLNPTLFIHTKCKNFLTPPYP
ncbi:hypothetical protein AAG570_010474 [Ranatra chinensis]|uniref:Uncharacterized protein n=1 Tax=Ranatra chinensis TaxID=642074 RepID=A0ABD0YMP4_9HEMI